MEDADLGAIRRVTLALLLAQSIASAALITSSTVNPIVAAGLGGQDAYAGLPTALMLAGASLAAYPAGRVMGRIGRRYGLLIGTTLGISGALAAALSVMAGTLPGFLASLALLGAGRGILDQGRYAAAEVNPPERRARALSTVIFGGTVGAIAGPLLVAPTSGMAQQLGVAPLAGPYLGTAALLAAAGAVIFFLLRVDLRGLAQRAALAGIANMPDRPARPATQRSFLQVLAAPDARAAVVTMACAQAAMVMMMAIIGLHMTHHDHMLADVSLVTSAHVLGMYAFSPLLGQLIDRVGRRAMIAASALTIATGCVVAPLSLDTPWIALALFLIGVGWSGCFIAGSTLLTDALGTAERARLQGANDAFVNIVSAAGSLSSGVLLQAFGFTVLSAAGLGIALLPVLAIAGGGRRVAPAERV